MPTDTPAVSVVVPARNAVATLGRTLDALSEQDLDRQFEVIVVDNGSTDCTAALADEHHGHPLVLRNPSPGGPGAARNLGAEAATAPVIAFTDSDCFPTRSWLARGLEAMQAQDLVQGAVQPDPSADKGPFHRTIAVEGESGLYQTANLFVRRELWAEIGGFEDWIVQAGDGIFGWEAPRDGRFTPPASPPFGEDVLFGWHARRRGARTGFAPEALVHHAVFPRQIGQAVRYRWAWRHFPALAQRIPEMRDEVFYRRWFLDRRTAGFDCAFASVVLALVSRRRLFLIGALPYAERVGREAFEWRGRGAVRVAVGTVATDLATLGALAVGSVGWRRLLI